MSEPKEKYPVASGLTEELNKVGISPEPDGGFKQIEPISRGKVKKPRAAHIVRLDFGSQGLYTTDIIIAQNHLSCIIDSGATVNLINWEVYNKIKDSADKIDEESTLTQGKAIDGTSFEITSFVTMENCYFSQVMDKPFTMKFAIIKTDFCETLIGIKQMREFSMILDTGSDRLIIPATDPSIERVYLVKVKPHLEDQKGLDRWRRFITAPTGRKYKLEDLA